MHSMHGGYHAWRLSFAVCSRDRLLFQGIIWGMSDDNKIRDKYITVFKDGKTSRKNTQHSERERQ